MSAPEIYHCTPLTPRAALEEIGVGRNFCVSFWRPDDCEVVERIASTVMFRQRSFFGVAGGHEARRGMVRSRGLDALLSLAGITAAQQSLGHHTGRTGSPFPAQRRAAQRMAVRAGIVRTGLAHGRTNRPATAALRQVAHGLHRMDWLRCRQGCRMHGLVRADAGNRTAFGWSLAAASSPARGACLARVPLCQSRREQRRAERTSV